MRRLEHDKKVRSLCATSARHHRGAVYERLVAFAMARSVRPGIEKRSSRHAASRDL
jgi:hypothetical protein